MKKIIRLTERELLRIVRRVIKEQGENVLYGEDGPIQDFCKAERESIFKILKISELPEKCFSENENDCAVALLNIAYKKNTSGGERINLNYAKNAGFDFTECNKKNEEAKKVKKTNQLYV